MSHPERSISDIVGEEVWRSIAWLLLSLCGMILVTSVLGLVPYDENAVVAVPTAITVTLTLSLIGYRALTGAEARIF